MVVYRRRTQDLEAGIGIICDQDEGHLRLDCREDEFIRIRDLDLSGTSKADRLGPLREGIRSIVVRRMAAARDTISKRWGRESQILCALALVISLAIQVTGIVAVIRWLWGLGS
jgi:hypothetical protein